MATAYSTLLGLALPVQGELSGTWGDTVDNGITRYVDIAVAGTVTLTNDGAVSLSLTNGDSSQTNIVSSLTGAGTVSAQFAIIKVTGTLTTAKVLTPPSSSRTYVVVNAATGSTVTVKASGQTGVSIAVGETAFVYFNGTDYVKVAGTVNTGVTSFQTSLSGLTPSTATTGAVTLAGTLGTSSGGTNLTSFTSGGVVYASSTSALATGSALTFSGANLGIGISSASQRVHIYESTAATGAFLQVQEVGGQNAYFGVNTSGGSIQVTGANPLQFSINGSEQMRLTSTGLGIGTSSPTAKLQVNGATFSNNSTSSAFLTAGSQYYGSIANTSGANTYSLGYSTDGSTHSSVLYWNASGNVGIGTNSPTSKLTVAGAISVNTGAANLNALGLLSGSSGNRIGLSLGRTAQEAYIGIASTSNSIINGDVAGDLDILTTTGNIRFSTNAGASLQATLDSAGNLGLGVTPSAWISGALSLDIRSTSSYADIGGSTSISNNGYRNSGGGWVYKTTNYATRFETDTGKFYWLTAPSGTAGNPISFTQAMTLSAGGNLVIGDTTGNGRLSVRDSSAALQEIYTTAGTGYAALEIKNGSGGVYLGKDNSAGSFFASGTGYASCLYSYGAFPLVFFTNGTERARISAAGGFSVGTTADPGAGAIYATGNITAYYSDARLKTVSGKIENALDKVAQLSGVYYTNNSVAKSFGYDSDEVQVGVLAQDVEAVLPQIVKAAPFDLDQDGNSKSGKNYKTVQYERLVPLLIEAINELQAKVKALESK